MQTDHLILVQIPDLVLNNEIKIDKKKKRELAVVDFSVSLDLRLKIKESKKIKKY